MTNKKMREEKEMNEKDSNKSDVNNKKAGSELKIKNKPEQSEIKTEAKPEEKAEEKKAETKVQEKPKKTEAVVNAYDVPISTKHSAAICRFIRGKKIEDAVSDLEAVLNLKKAVPMRGEIPHRRGKGMMSGRFPIKAAKNFIKLLKSLSANSDNLGIDEPVIAEAVANIGARPYGRFGAVRKKRTHIKIVARNKSNEKK